MGLSLLEGATADNGSIVIDAQGGGVNPGIGYSEAREKNDRGRRGAQGDLSAHEGDQEHK